MDLFEYIVPCMRSFYCSSCLSKFVLQRALVINGEYGPCRSAPNSGFIVFVHY